MPFKMHKIIFFPEKKICVPILPKISDLLPKTHLFFYLALLHRCAVLHLCFYVCVFFLFFSKNGCVEGIVQRLKTYKDPELKFDIKVRHLRCNWGPPRGHMFPSPPEIDCLVPLFLKNVLLCPLIPNTIQFLYNVMFGIHSTGSLLYTNNVINRNFTKEL